MKIQTQIRRTVLSLATLLAFGAVALARGESLASQYPIAGKESLNGSAVVCELPAPDGTVIEAPVVRLDWRAHLPATIARSRS